MQMIETKIDIAAPPAAVWRILTDFAAMPAWNPFIRAIKGAAVPGSRLTVRIAPPGRSQMTFRPAVLIVDEPYELRWLGVVMNRRIFSGEHFFKLAAIGTGATRFRHGEKFSGLLASLLMRGAILDATRQGFLAMNAALKERAERDSQL
jgi:hypothetical protein